MAEEEQERDYIVRYTTTEGDSSKCWFSARDEEHAKELARDEYWDIAEITSVELM